MTKQKATKRALLASALALVLCFSLLVGSTYAWFTDTASTGNTVIQSGSLKVDIVDDSGASLEGQALAFQNVNGETDILWEPGVTFRTQAFKIKNAGNLALKYRLVLNGVDGNAELLEVITFSLVKADGTAVELDTFEGVLNEQDDLSEAYYIQGVMDSSAGNDYQDKRLEGISVAVIAGQAMYESDSEDDTYDANAEYPQSQPNLPQTPTFTVGTASQLQAAMQPTGNGDERIINIVADLELAAGENWLPLSLDSYVGVSRIVINGNNHTIKGPNESLLDQAIFGNTKVEINDLTLEDSTVSRSGSYGGAFVSYSDNAISVTLNNCHLVGGSVTSAKYAGGLIGYVAGTVTLTDCSVSGTTVTGESVGALVGMVSVAQGSETATIGMTSVTGCNLISTKNGTRRVGELIGTANIPYVTLSDVTTSGNTCTQTGSTGLESGMVSTSWIGRASSAVTGDTSAVIS